MLCWQKLKIHDYELFHELLFSQRDFCLEI